MNEADTRVELIDPKLKACDWGVVEGSKILLECKIWLICLIGKTSENDIILY